MYTDVIKENDVWGKHILFKNVREIKELTSE